MSSSTPSRSIDSDSSLTNVRFRSLSISSSSRDSHSVSRELSTRRSQTPKVRRKTVSNRSIPYISPSLSRTSQSKNSTITTFDSNSKLDDSIDLTSTDVSTVPISSQQNSVNQEQTAFERSSDEEKMNTKENKTSSRATIAQLMNYFTSKDKNKYMCNICEELKTTNGSSTFNLRRHLARRHQIYIGTNVSSDQKQKNQSQNNSIVDKQRREELDNLLLNCIIRGGLPFNHFSHSWFDELFEKFEPGYQAPDRRTFKKRIQDYYYEYIDELKQLLPKDRPIAYTTDVWKSPTRDHFICLTAHMFDDELKPMSILLSFRRLTDRKLSKNLYDFIAYELNRFGLKDCLHAGITTDNAGDIKAATRFGDFGPRFPCIAHTLNLIIYHGLCIWKLPNENKYPFKPYNNSTEVDDDDDENDLINLIDDVEDEIIDAEQTPDYIELNAQQSSESHNVITLPDIDIPSPVVSSIILNEDQFISDNEETNDSSRDLSALIDNDKKQLLEVLHKTHALLVRTRKLVKIMRNISAIDQYIRSYPSGPENGFVIDIRTRWNSTFYMIARLIKYQLVVKSVFIHKFPSINAEQRYSLALNHINHESWDLVQDLYDILGPFELATRSLSGKYYATLALAYTTINILKFGLMPKQHDSRHVVLMKKSLLAQFELYFDKKMTKTQKELMLVASYLDPKSHRQLDREDKKAAKAILPHYMKKESQSIIDSSSSSSSIITKTNLTLTEKLKIMVGMPTNMKPPRTLSIEDELVLFTQAIQDFKSNFSSFWLQYNERFPCLYRVAQRVNIIPATSVPSESIFSITGYVARKQRASLSSTSLRYLMVLKESHQLDALRRISRNATH